MKVLLIQPPIEDFYDTSVRTYPLGLLYIGARLARSPKPPFSTRGRVCTRRRSTATTSLSSIPSIRSRPSRPFLSLTATGASASALADIRDRIAKERPDIVAVSSMCSAYERQALEVVEATKEVSKDIVTVMGGVHPTLFPSHVLANGRVDYCIRGEGETPFFELVRALSEGAKGNLASIEGLCFRQGEQLHISQANAEKGIDVLPARHLVEADRYRIGRRRYTFFLTSRGCPFSCGFCGKPPAPYRKRGLTSIEEEIEACAALGVEAIDFEDDMLNLDKDFFAHILHATLGRGFTLSAMNGIYPGNMDIAMLRLMYDAGFRRLNFSLVDISESILRTQKRASQESFLKLLPFLETSPFLVEVHFIIGLPGQDPENLLDTILFLMDKRLLLGPSLFYLAPGSPLHRAEAGRGEELPFRSMRSSIMLPFNPLFPRNITYTFVKIVRFVNHVKQLLDQNTGVTRMSDLIDAKGPAHDPRKRAVLETLVREHRFVRYDQKAGRLTEEPVEAGLVHRFFARAKGSKIKGYRTRNVLVVDG